MMIDWLIDYVISVIIFIIILIYCDVAIVTIVFGFLYATIVVMKIFIHQNTR